MSQSSYHGPAEPSPIDRHNSRWGLILFAIYVALYLGFMVLAAFNPDQMAKPTSIAGVNLAIVYGIGLIVAALVLAFVYTLVSKSPDVSP